MGEKHRIKDYGVSVECHHIVDTILCHDIVNIVLWKLNIATNV